MKRDAYYLIAISVLVLLCFFFMDRWSAERLENKQKTSVIAEQQDTIRYHRNARARLVAEKRAAEIKATEIAEAYPQLAKKIIDDFEIKLKNVKSALQQEIRASGKGNATTNNYYIDSLGRRYAVKEMRVDDGYLSFKAILIDSLHTPYEYTYRDTITTVVHSEKKWLFGKETLHVSSEMGNKNASVSKMTSVLVNNYRDKRWVVSVGVYYDPLRNQYGPAVMAGYKLIGF